MASNKYRVGDTVVITDSERPELAKSYWWRSEWDNFKGRRAVVTDVTLSSGYGYLLEINGENLGGWFAGKWLNPVPKKTKSTAKLPTKPIQQAELIKLKKSILGQDKAKKHLAVAIERNLSVLLVGETGTGKTTLVKELADKHNKQLVRFSITGETSVEEFVGKYTLIDGNTIWQDGVLLQAMKKGQWLVADEVNVALPEILFVLHSLLDDDKQVLVTNHDSEIVKPHADFRFFGAMNPVDEYAGTKDLNKAFKSRFAMILEIKTPLPAIERKIVQVKGNTTPEVSALLVDIATMIRKAKQADEVFFTCSTRDLIQTAQLVEPLGLDDAITIGLVNKANGDTVKIKNIIKNMHDGYIEAIEQSITLNLEEAIALNQAKEAVVQSEAELKAQIKAELEQQYSKHIKSDETDRLSSVTLDQNSIASAKKLVAEK